MNEEIIAKLQSVAKKVKEISSEYDIDISIFTVSESNETPGYETFTFSTGEESFTSGYSFDYGKAWTTHKEEKL